MGIVLILAVLAAMNAAAFAAARLLLGRWPEAFAAARLSTITFIVAMGVWMGMMQDAASAPSEATIYIVLLAVAGLAMTVLVRWRLAGASWLKALFIGIATAAAMAGGYAGGVALFAA